jgi:hypothetical protein
MNTFNTYSKQVFLHYLEIKYIRDSIDEGIQDISNRFKAKRNNTMDKKRFVSSAYNLPKKPSPPKESPSIPKLESPKPKTSKTTEYKIILYTHQPKRRVPMEEKTNPHYKAATPPIHSANDKKKLLRKLYRAISLVIHPDKARIFYDSLFTGVAMSELQDAYDNKDISLMVTLYYFHLKEGNLKKVTVSDITIVKNILDSLSKHLCELRGNTIYKFTTLSDIHKNKVHGTWFSPKSVS